MQVYFESARSFPYKLGGVSRASVKAYLPFPSTAPGTMNKSRLHLPTTHTRHTRPRLYYHCIVQRITTLSIVIFKDLSTSLIYALLHIHGPSTMWLSECLVNLFLLPPMMSSFLLSSIVIPSALPHSGIVFAASLLACSTSYPDLVSTGLLFSRLRPHYLRISHVMILSSWTILSCSAKATGRTSARP